jgi:hypothetical protein
MYKLTDETVACESHKLRTAIAHLGDRPVEIFDGLAEPHADDEKSSQTCSQLIYF